MVYYGNYFLSSSNSDWGGFGSFIGGVLAPFSSLLAAYLVFKNLEIDTKQKRLEIVRESIKRQDEQFTLKLTKNIRNPEYSSSGQNISFEQFVTDLSYSKTKASDGAADGILGLLQNISMMALSLEYYLSLLKDFEKDRVHSDWLNEAEKYYWINKYSPICNHMVRVIGMKGVKERLTFSQFKAMRHICPGTFE